MARSLAKKPQLLLLDEPLGALDKKLREETQIELANIIHDVGVTCVLVTHDQEEAMTMAARIAVMSEGRFLQVGAPAEIYETPASRFVADFIGNVNLMDGTLVEDEADHVVVDCGDVRHRVGHGITGTRGMAVTVALRPEKIQLRRDALSSAATPATGVNRAHGTIKEVAYFGSFTVYHLQMASGRILKISQSNVERQPGAPLTWGDSAWATLDRPLAGRADAMKVGGRGGRFAVIAVPYAWLLVFFLLPFLVVARISVSEMETTTIKDIVTWKDGAIAFSAKVGNYLLLAQDDLYLRTYGSSLLYAAVTTAAVPGDRLSVRVFHGAGTPVAAAGAADAGDAAVLDLVPAPRLRLEGAPHRAGPGGARRSRRSVSIAGWPRSG